MSARSCLLVDLSQFPSTEVSSTTRKVNYKSQSCDRGAPQPIVRSWFVLLVLTLISPQPAAVLRTLLRVWVGVPLTYRVAQQIDLLTNRTSHLLSIPVNTGRQRQRLSRL